MILHDKNGFALKVGDLVMDDKGIFQITDIGIFVDMVEVDYNNDDFVINAGAPVRRLTTWECRRFVERI